MLVYRKEKIMKVPNPEDIAKQLVDVQPMPNESLKGLSELSKTEEELKEEGYKPVSSLGLMWIKEDKEE